MKQILTTISLLAISSYTFAQEAKRSQQETFTVVEQMPEFPQGPEAMYQFINEHIQYPEDAKKAGITGQVVVRFVIEADGTPTGFKIAKGIPEAPSLDLEAIRVLKQMPKWKPGKQNGKPVAVMLSLPVSYTIE